MFTTPLLLNNLKVLSRPISYLKAEISCLDGLEHQVQVSIQVEDDVCLNLKQESPTQGSTLLLSEQIPCAKMGNVNQSILNTAGDDVRINWGYFYLAAKGEGAQVLVHSTNDQISLEASVKMNVQQQAEALFVFAYDDLYSLQYFNDNIKGY
ncbi:MAG: DUF5127 domain-containing protein, partial [Vallitaleaceae bacterium]|nr:DUF5127 domain-containing protein [Vallitaleaceae bacterium]